MNPHLMTDSPNVAGDHSREQPCLPVTASAFSVTNKEHWEHPQVDNEALVGQVQRAILGTGRGTLQRVAVLADAGHVVLCGRVPTYYMKQLAQQTAMDVPGVDRVENQLLVK
jgi:osmotically-inducible protein OsmY